MNKNYMHAILTNFLISTSMYKTDVQLNDTCLHTSLTYSNYTEYLLKPSYTCNHLQMLYMLFVTRSIDFKYINIFSILLKEYLDHINKCYDQTFKLKTNLLMILKTWTNTKIYYKSILFQCLVLQTLEKLSCVVQL